MPATSEDRLFGLTTSVAVKPPVAISADYNVTTFGEQTITSSTMTGDRTVTTTQDMRVLLMNQDDKRDNGIWMAGPVTWRRAPDFDGSRDAVDGTLVFSIYGDCWQLEGTNPIHIGNDEISFRSTYPFSEELNLYQRTIRTSDLYIEPLPSLSEAEGKTIVVQSGVPRWVTPESGTATDVLTELAKSDGATKIGSGTHTVQHVLDMKFDKTGGTVNGPLTVDGDIISHGDQITLKGDDRKHFGMQDRDGRYRMWLYKDKGGDGVRLNNGDDGGGEYVFHKDGGFRAPSSVYAGAARIASDGDLTGPIWGGTLSGCLEKKINSVRKRTREVVIWSGRAWSGMKVSTNKDILGALIYLRYAEWKTVGTYVPFMVPVNIGTAATVSLPGDNWLTIKPISAREFEIVASPVAYDEILLSE